MRSRPRMCGSGSVREPHSALGCVTIASLVHCCEPRPWQYVNLAGCYLNGPAPEIAYFLYNETCLEVTFERHCRTAKAKNENEEWKALEFFGQAHREREREKERERERKREIEREREGEWVSEIGINTFYHFLIQILCLDTVPSGRWLLSSHTGATSCCSIEPGPGITYNF